VLSASILVRLRRLFKAGPFLRRLPAPLPHQSRPTQHPPHAGRTHRHDVCVQHHESFHGFFTTNGQEVISKICFVCSDMWEPYLKLIRERCSEALHILDRFHIVANMNKALDKVRAEETSRMKREGRDPVLKKSRWLLLKRSENLGDEQHFRLRDLLGYNLKTVRAYLLKEAFQQLWDYNSAGWWVTGEVYEPLRNQNLRDLRKKSAA
jgi:transposase